MVSRRLAPRRGYEPRRRFEVDRALSWLLLETEVKVHTSRSNFQFWLEVGYEGPRNLSKR